MAVTFQFKQEISPFFGIISRPIAEVFLKHTAENIWQPVTMIIDTGADYTLLPLFLATPLGVNVKNDCRKISTRGVGGKSAVFLLNDKIDGKIGNLHRSFPLGFLSHNYIPPLLGRREFFETFKVVFDKLTVTFS